MAAPQTASIAGPLTVESFLRLIRSLPPEQIARIPVEHLPENVPANIAQHLPAPSRQAVENLLLAANSYHLARRMRDEKTYGKAVVNALDRAKLSGDTANVRVFKDKILALLTMLQESQRERGKHPLGLFVKNIGHINTLLVDVRSEVVTIYNAARVLREARPANEDDEVRFARALKRLEEQNEAVEKLLAEYYIFRLKIMSRAIAAKRREIEEEERKNAHIPQQIERLRKQLEETRSFWRRTLNPRKSEEEAREIQQQIAELIHELEANEVVISENELTDWLDALVDASINEYARPRITRMSRDFRVTLYFLLNTYCRKQEESAYQIAQNPFIQVDPEKAIRYVLLSEQFILDYFANKKKDTATWLAGAAKSKIQELDRLEKEILAELRRSSKLMAKRRKL
jgi:hypothetical protein